MIQDLNVNQTLDSTIKATTKIPEPSSTVQSLAPFVPATPISLVSSLAGILEPVTATTLALVAADTPTTTTTTMIGSSVALLEKGSASGVGSFSTSSNLHTSRSRDKFPNSRGIQVQRHMMYVTLFLGNQMARLKCPKERPKAYNQYADFTARPVIERTVKIWVAMIDDPSAKGPRVLGKEKVNRRLDEWVKLEQLELESVETHADEKIEDKGGSLKMTRHQKRKIDETHVEEVGTLLRYVWVLGTLRL
eukprot:Gb_32485 [translate_table: standard]